MKYEQSGNSMIGGFSNMIRKQCFRVVSVVLGVLCFWLMVASPLSAAPNQEVYDKACIDSCKSYLKNNWLIMLQVVQDDEKECFPLTLSSFDNYFRRYQGMWLGPESLRPVEPDTRICFLDKRPNVKTSYGFNKHLVGLPMASIKNLDKVVLLYEGSDGKFDFRHKNQAHVLFVNGTIRLVDKKSVRTLKWKP